MRAIPLPITVEELHALVHEELLTDQQIADRLGSTKKRVQNWRGRYKVPSLPRWKRNQVTPIEGDLKSLLVGSMLGDGRIVHRTHASHYEEFHALNQKDYLEWKEAFWGSWGRGIVDRPSKKGYPGASFRTCAHGDLNEWRDMFYKERSKGWKILRPEIVDLVDPLALAVWYMDDGGAAWWPDLTFGAKDGSLDVAWAIFEKFGLKPRWQLVKGETGVFHMEREDTAEKFLEIISPHVPPCMQKKITGFGFQGKHYQARKKAPVEVLREMASKGTPIKQMARELGIGASTVDRYLKKHNIPHPRKIGAPKHY